VLIIWQLISICFTDCSIFDWMMNTFGVAAGTSVGTWLAAFVF